MSNLAAIPSDHVPTLEQRANALLSERAFDPTMEQLMKHIANREAQVRALIELCNAWQAKCNALRARLAELEGRTMRPDEPEMQP